LLVDRRILPAARDGLPLARRLDVAHERSTAGAVGEQHLVGVSQAAAQTDRTDQGDRNHHPAASAARLVLAPGQAVVVFAVGLWRVTLLLLRSVLRRLLRRRIALRAVRHIAAEIVIARGLRPPLRRRGAILRRVAVETRHRLALTVLRIAAVGLGLR